MTPNAYRYTGQQSDADSGLLYLRARYYEPSTGRFITQDKKSGDPKIPSTLNLYVYCKNNPIRYSDPSGYKEEAYGPNDSYVKWNSGSFRLPRKDPPSGSKQDKAWQIIAPELQTDDNNMVNSNPGWDCYSWRDTFIHLGTKACPNKFGAEKYTVTPKKALMDLMKAVTSQGIDLVSITAFINILPNYLHPKAAGHTYIYFRFRFKTGSDLWVFSEADGSSILEIPSGDIHYRSYPVEAPK